MSAAPAGIQGIVPASRLVTSAETGRSGAFSFDALRGRLIEIPLDVGTPAFSVVSLLLREAQAQSEPAAWVTSGTSIFYPPDFEVNGVNVTHLPVVWSGSRECALRSTEHLLRSGAFGLVVVDLDGRGEVRTSRLGAINRLAEFERALVVFLTVAGKESELGSLISARFIVDIVRKKPNRFVCRIRAVKDRRAPDGWVEERIFRGADGLY